MGTSPLQVLRQRKAEKKEGKRKEQKKKTKQNQKNKQTNKQRKRKKEKYMLEKVSNPWTLPYTGACIAYCMYVVHTVHTLFFF